MIEIKTLITRVEKNIPEVGLHNVVSDILSSTEAELAFSRLAIVLPKPITITVEVLRMGAVEVTVMAGSHTRNVEHIVKAHEVMESLMSLPEEFTDAASSCVEAMVLGRMEES